MWGAVDGEILQTRRETSNDHGGYNQDSTVVGHVPRKILAICSLFLRRYGVVSCRVSGSRRYVL